MIEVRVEHLNSTVVSYRRLLLIITTDIIAETINKTIKISSYIYIENFPTRALNGMFPTENLVKQSMKKML